MTIAYVTELGFSLSPTAPDGGYNATVLALGLGCVRDDLPLAELDEESRAEIKLQAGTLLMDIRTVWDCLPQALSRTPPHLHETKEVDRWVSP